LPILWEGKPSLLEYLPELGGSKPIDFQFPQH